MKLRSSWKSPDFSDQGWGRVVLLTIVGTLCCVAFAFAFDSYSLADGQWRLGSNPWNNVIIPMLIAPPFFFYLLSKLRQLAIAHARLMVVASTDSLTECLNRLAFTTLVDAYLERIDMQERRRNGALLVLDVDHFKLVNDKFGHDAGDEALRIIAQSIKSALRDADLIGRMGGEEFCVFLPGVTPDRAMTIAERIRRTVMAAGFFPEGVSCDLSISVGGVSFLRDTSFSELYKIADEQLYGAKRKGRNRVEFVQLTTGVQSPAAMH